MGKEVRLPTHSHGQVQRDISLLLTMREPRLTTFVSSLCYRFRREKRTPLLMWLSHEKGKTIDQLIRPVSHCLATPAFFF
jgi:hypothetical protein